MTARDVMRTGEYHKSVGNVFADSEGFDHGRAGTVTDEGDHVSYAPGLKWYVGA